MSNLKKKRGIGGIIVVLTILEKLSQGRGYQCIVCSAEDKMTASKKRSKQKIRIPILTVKAIFNSGIPSGVVDILSLGAFQQMLDRHLTRIA